MAFPVADLIAAVHLEFSEESKKKFEREWGVFSKRLIGFGIGALAAKAIKEFAEEVFESAILMDRGAEAAFSNLQNSVNNVFDNIGANIAPALTEAMKNLADAMVAAGPAIALVSNWINRSAMQYLAAASLYGVAINQVMSDVYKVISLVPGHQVLLPGAAKASAFHSQEVMKSWEKFKELQKNSEGKSRFVSPEESEEAHRKKMGGGEMVKGSIEGLQFELMKREFESQIAKNQLDIAQQQLTTLKSIDAKSGGGATLQ